MKQGGDTILNTNAHNAEKEYNVSDAMTPEKCVCGKYLLSFLCFFVFPNFPTMDMHHC